MNNIGIQVLEQNAATALNRSLFTKKNIIHPGIIPSSQPTPILFSFTVSLKFKHFKGPF